MRPFQQTRRGLSLVGLLVTMVCIVILFAILMNAMNNAVTGGGSTQQDTVYSMADELTLYTMYQSFVAYANENRGRYLVPSELGNLGDHTLDTTANFWSAMIAQNYVYTHQLIAANEYNPNIWEDEDYDFTRYSPAMRSFWDPAFKADLEWDSNVSFAHMPLHGERMRKHWKSDFTRMPIFGNRGPKDGIDNPQSYTYGRNGQWAGHVVFGDGSVRFLESFTPAGLTYDGVGGTMPDNIFAMESGADGNDAILAFTKEMTSGGPVLQYD